MEFEIESEIEVVDKPKNKTSRAKVATPDNFSELLENFYNSMGSQKYRKHYEKLVARAKARKLEQYVEKHHIIPRCFGGLNCPDNMVELTPEEHFVAHQFLTVAFPNNKKLMHAAKMMTTNKWGRRSNKLYGWLRQRLSENQRGKNHHNYGKKASPITISKMSATRKDRTVPEETKLKMSEAQKNRPPISEETRLKMSASQKTKVVTEEHKANISKSLKGNKFALGTKQTKETCLKISDSLKGNKRALGSKRTKEDALRIGACHKGKKQTAEQVRKRMESSKLTKERNKATKEILAAWSCAL